LDQKKTFPDGNVGRVKCCRLLKTDALWATLSGKGTRFRLNHETDQYTPDTNQEPYTGVFAGICSDEEGSRSKECLPLNLPSVSLRTA
jgi:sulfate adenylyltransferase subunit 2